MTHDILYELPPGHAPPPFALPSLRPCGLVVDNNSGDNKDKPSNLAQNAIESFLATDNLTMTTTTTTSSRLK